MLYLDKLNVKFACKEKKSRTFVCPSQAIGKASRSSINTIHHLQNKGAIHQAAKLACKCEPASVLKIKVWYENLS